MKIERKHVCYIKCRDLGTVPDRALLSKIINSKNPFELHHDTIQCNAVNL